MNKRRKLLSIILCTGIVGSTFPCSGTGATSDSIAFYNSKKTILDMRGYDEAYDTNHDGIVNVFDVIRENKEVFQEESYTDLKSQIHSLETRIEILAQKLAEKEDKTQAESNLSEIYSSLSGKTNQQDGKQLSSNDYTDEEKQKLENLNSYDDTKIKSELSELSSNLSFKVDKEEDKQLSSNDFTDAEKQKLESLNNYDDTSIKSDISEISSSLSMKIDNQEGKQLSTNDYTDEDKIKLASLENYNDNDIKSEISTINSELSTINHSLYGKVDQQEGKQLSSNDYTDSDKEKLDGLENYDDAKINKKIDSLVQTAYEEKKEIEYSIQNKVDKEDGKQLSSNDYTDEEKQKLESLHNYDDTDLLKEINNVNVDFKEYVDSINLLQGKNIVLAGDSRSSELYPNYVLTLSEKTKANVTAIGWAGSSAAQQASNNYFSRFDGTEDFIIWLTGGNDSGTAVGTFDASYEGLENEKVVQETDINVDYNGSYFIQAVDHMMRKWKSLYYDWKSLNSGHKPILIFCSEIPQQRYGADNECSKKENWIRKCQAIKQCCEKNGIYYLDLYNICNFDMSFEPYWTPQASTTENNGLYYMDGLHINKYGYDIITSAEIEAMKKYIRIYND